MNKASERTARYDAKSTRRYGLKLNLKTDKEIIDKLDAVGSMQGYIKQLIRQDMTLSPYLRMLVLKDAEGYELMDVFRENGLRKARLIKGNKIVHVIEKEDGNITVEEGGA